MSRHTLGQEIALQTSVSLSIQRRNRKHLFDAFPRGLRPQQRTATTRDPARDGVQKLPHGTYPFTRRAFESRPFGHQHSIFPTTPRPKAPLHPSGTCFITSIRSEPPGGDGRGAVDSVYACVIDPEGNEISRTNGVGSESRDIVELAGGQTYLLVVNSDERAQGVLSYSIGPPRR